MMVGTTLGAALILGLFAYSDGSRLLGVLREVDVYKLAWPVLCTIGSYAAMARSYQKIADAAGLHLPFGETLRITLVSTSANYILSTGGLSGLAVRSYYFFQQHELGWGAAVSISLAQTFITNVVLFAFLCWGVLSLSLTDEVSTPTLPVVGFLFLLALALSALVVSVVASRRARQRIFAALI
ncbi:MAG: lysylphosphatidylglycerol synthase domain-containing protein, partial [Candidatus Binatia bacterium]